MINALIGAATGLGIVVLFVTWALTPVVYHGHSTRECVSVLSPNPTHTCTNKPPRYVRVWAE